MAEVDRKLSGARISDAWQAGRNEIVLLPRNGQGTVLSIDPVRPGLFLLDRDRLPERVVSPLTDLLRARVRGTTVGRVRMTEPGERIVTLAMAAAWPAKAGTPLEVVLEVMGRRSNLMILEEGRILQPLRTVPREKSPARPVVAGEPYRHPPALQGVAVEEVTADLFAFGGAAPDADSLRDLVRGLSPYAASQILSEGLPMTIGSDPGAATEADRIALKIGEMVASCTGERGFLHRTGVRVHLSPFEPVPFGDADSIETFTPFSAAAAAWKSSNLSDPAKPGDASDHLETGLHQRLEHIETALMQLDAQEERCRSHDDIRVMAEALLIGVNRVKAGSDSVTLPDPYGDGSTLDISLHRGKSPQENANELFIRARRLKRGLEEVVSRRGRLNGEKGQVLEALEALKSGRDTEPARRLLEGTNAMAGSSGKAGVPSYTGPGRRHIVDGFTILVGRNSRDNEKVTFSAAGPSDLWLHARDYPGSHVVIITRKRHVPDKVLYQAAALAAAGSGAKNDTAPEIMVTERKWVRKLKGGKPGQVTVERFKTIRPRSQKSGIRRNK